MTTTTEIDDFDGLVARLAAFGDRIDVDDAGLVDAVLNRLDAPRRRDGRGNRPWLMAAAIAILVAGIVLHPDSRQAVARWLGLDGVVIEFDPSLSVPPEDPAAAPLFEAPGPGESEVVVVGGREVLVSAIEGGLDERLVSKVVSSTDQVEVVDVMGHRGLWISGAPHEVMYASPDGDVVVERLAANTLLWHDGAVLYRLEGFEELADALAFVSGT